MSDSDTIELSADMDLSYRENTRLRLENIRRLRCRALKQNWDFDVPVKDDQVDNLLEAVGAAREASYELIISPLASRREIVCRLHTTPSHLTTKQVTEIVDELGQDSQRILYLRFRLHSDIKCLLESTRETGETSFEIFREKWQKLAATVKAIVQNPHQKLNYKLSRHALHRRFQLNSQAVKTNISRGLLHSEGTPTRDFLYGKSAQATLDTPENAHVVSGVGLFVQKREYLLRQVRREIIRLEEERSLQNVGQKSQAFEQLKNRLEQLEGDLKQLSNIALPQEWHDFHRPPSRDTNRARFDVRYAKVVELESWLEQHMKEKPKERERRQYIEQLGKRRTWQLYEYWVVYKVYQALHEWGFRTKDDSGFGALEQVGQGCYALIPQQRIELRHQEATDLQITLTYEKHLQNGEMKPDMILELLSPQYRGIPLSIDAKYSAFSGNYVGLEEIFQKSARRYREALEDSSDGSGAMAFLVHVGYKENPYIAWPVAQSQTHTAPFPLSYQQDVPYKGGIIFLRPGDDSYRQVKRMLVAWLFQNRVIRICFSCGADMSKHGEMMQGEPCQNFSGWNEPFKEFSERAWGYPRHHYI